jgi:hypothetical protein
MGAVIDRRAFCAGALCVGGLALAWPSTAAATCDRRLTRDDLERSLEIGTRYLLASQKKKGNFVYELDWHTLRESDEDHSVRQAGAAWALALLYRAAPGKRLGKALKKALSFFAKSSRERDDGARYVVYPDWNKGALGTVAIVALAHLEYLSVKKDAALSRHLAGYLRFLVSARKDGGTFAGDYDRDGTSRGEASPYYDGEALLALAKAARQLGRDDLKKLVLDEATIGHRRYVTDALAEDPDSNLTKAYFHWAILANFELATWPAIDAAPHEERILQLADWMLDVHRPLARQRNTAYAFEGIVPAYAIAKGRQDAALVDKYGCAIDRGLSRLLSWQVGHPRANQHIAGREAPARAIGGVQNHAKEPALRIDVTQHQMHAVLLALEHWAEEVSS